MSSSRKRPRSRQAESPNDGQEEEEEEDLLTPHTKRLLKLVEEGTASHAQLAASHLKEMAARASPLVLWDLLGRLQSLLIRQTWTCRQHAHWAMQGVAQSLPRWNQEEFLAQPLPDENQNLWLAVEDLDISLVLQQGRLLLAAPEQDYDEDVLLDGLDASMADFVQQRIQLQRRILAKRLGLGGLVQATGKVEEWLPDSITTQDFIVPVKVKSEQITTKAKPTTPNNDKSIRAILVLEMKQQDSTTVISHQNPQQLLATELLYRMFDPYWHVRHGALLGITSLLQAWKLKENNAFGAWPQDILARSLCVLALDRFADFSSEATTAPVRLAAAQVVALLYNLAPDSVQEACRNILTKLATCPLSWEVRHGGLVAMQFLLVVEKKTVEFARIATQALEDDCDDVVAVAAQVLLVVAQRQETIPSCIDSLWKALLRVKSSVSSSAVPLVRLFAHVLQNQQQLPVNLEQVWNQMLRFLDFSSSAIQISTLQALANMMMSAAEHEQSDPIQRAYSALVLRIFDSFSEQNLHIDNIKTMERLSVARQEAWTKLVKVAPAILVSGKELLVGIMLRSIGLNKQNVQRKECCSLSQLHVACRAAAQLLSNLGESTKSFLHTTILSLLSSPWIRNCEIACLLYRSLCQVAGDLVLDCRSTLQDLLQTASPPCVLADGSPLVNDEQAMKAYDSVLVSTLEHKAWQCEKPATAIKDLALVVKKLNPMASEGSAKSSVAGMRISAMLAGALVSGGSAHLPQTLTPLVRALMTSLKSDADHDHIELTCTDLVSLLQLLPTQGKEQVRNKILSNICNLLKGNDLSTTKSAAVRVLENLVRELPAGDTVQALSPIWQCLSRLESSDLAEVDSKSLQEALNMMTIVGEAVVRGSKATSHLIESTIQPLILIACVSTDSANRKSAAACIKALAKADSRLILDKSIPLLAQHLQNKAVDSFRVGACKLLHGIIEEVDIEVCPFVRYLLPIAMSLMTDPVVDCAKEASKTFADLVRVAPLVREVAPVSWSLDMDDHSKSVMDHLIHGKPLPPCIFPSSIKSEMEKTGVTLRGYQAEGVAWLRFLQTVRLNGALCDSMGLGKTLQALVAIALAHNDSKPGGSAPLSLVVCPSSVVGHWVAEIQKFFPNVFAATALIGNAKERSKRWSDGMSDSHIVVTSYSVLRGDIERLRQPLWEYCVLDEGHLLKNPKTATAIAARQIRSCHRLILTGTPVQNRVSELWATFDFLMPNFLGSHAHFSKTFAHPIGKGQQPGASAHAINSSMDKLKLLHQQVLPFILRREKEQVLKELPPKCFTDIPCALTNEQAALYKSFCRGSDIHSSVSALQSLLESNGDTTVKLGTNVLKSLLYLRLLCTHPILVEKQLSDGAAATQLRRSGKLQALNELLRTAGVVPDELTAADNDTSTFYVDSETPPEEEDEFSSTLQDGNDTPFVTTSMEPVASNTKCLIFAQFMNSLDIVEKYLFQAHMPSLRYLRLDGRVPNERRTEIVNAFNDDESIQVLLLTTRVGGLGLNLTGASMVVFLEHDYNPFADLQAMDRAHRIGQTKTVNVYRLVTTDTIEEKIMDVQQAKIRMSNAIVNSENSSMYSMGTDRLLDIFTFRSEDNAKSSGKKNTSLQDLDDIYDQDDEYHSLSVEEFVKGFATKT
jgi:TATA-binding protein-associated factor